MKNKYIKALPPLLILLVVFGAISYKEIKNYPSSGHDIIAFGDSLVEGVGAVGDDNNFVSILSRRLNKPIINLGVSGDTTYDGLARLKELDNYNPKIVILLLGGNDTLRNIPISETKKNLEMIIKDIQRRGSMVIVLGIRGGVINDPFSIMYKNLSKEYRTGYVKDVLKGLLLNQKYMSDAIHPNNLGYEIIAQKVYPVVRRLDR